MATDSSLGEALRQTSDLSRPLCVALEGALLTTRVSWERVALLFRERPWLAVVLPFWLLGGPAALKRRTKDRVALDPASLPYRAALLAELRQCRAAGRTLVLVAGTDSTLAESVAQHLGLFAAVYTSDRSDRDALPKLEAQLSAAFPGGFDYVGHSEEGAPLMA